MGIFSFFKSNEKANQKNDTIIDKNIEKNSKFYVDEQKSIKLLNLWNDNSTSGNTADSEDMKRIKKTFSEKLKCEFVPVGVINYYLENDGEDIAAGYILSLEDIVNEISDFKEKFLPFMDIKDDNDGFIPFADDGMGGYYVFSSKRNDEKIYYLDHEYGPTKIDTFDNFGQWYSQIKSYEDE